MNIAFLWRCSPQFLSCTIVSDSYDKYFAITCTTCYLVYRVVFLNEVCSIVAVHANILYNVIMKVSLCFHYWNLLPNLLKIGLVKVSVWLASL